MKIVVVCHRADRPDSEFEPHLAPEAKLALQMMAKNVIREIYSRQDKKGAILVFEEESGEAVDAHMKTLPLVKAGLLNYEIYPLLPYRAIAAMANA